MCEFINIQWLHLSLICLAVRLHFTILVIEVSALFPLLWIRRAGHWIMHFATIYFLIFFQSFLQTLENSVHIATFQNNVLEFAIWFSKTWTMVGEHTGAILSEGITLGVQSMYFFGLKTEMDLDVRSCIMDANAESSSPGHHLCIIFMAPIFVQSLVMFSNTSSSSCN